MSDDAAPSDINELFSRDPMKLSDLDIDRIIMEFRKRRNIFNSNPAAAAAKAPGKALTTKEKAASSLKIEFDL